MPTTTVCLLFGSTFLCGSVGNSAACNLNVGVC